MADTGKRVFNVQNLEELPHHHYPMVFGAVCGQLGISASDTCSSFMSGVARTALASAVRLDKIGPVEVHFDITRLLLSSQSVDCRLLQTLSSL